jgi:hypothetical protein
MTTAFDKEYTKLKRRSRLLDTISTIIAREMGRVRAPRKRRRAARPTKPTTSRVQPVRRASKHEEPKQGFLPGLD